MLSPQSVHRRLDPYPAATSRCIYPLLPRRHRPHVTFHTFGSQDNPCTATSTGAAITGLQSFRDVQAPMLARPPGCAYRCSVCAAGQPGRLLHAMDLRLPSGTVVSLRA